MFTHLFNPVRIANQENGVADLIRLQVQMVDGTPGIQYHFRFGNT
jgi:hypothetical protein